MTISVSRLVQRALPAWHLAAQEVVVDRARLADGLQTRWARNASTVAPDGMPAMPGISEEYGWSTALELYLTGFDDADERCEALFAAFVDADLSLAEPSRGEVWLGDVLALRRMPHAAHAVPAMRRSVADMRVADHILDRVAILSRCIPTPDEEAYAFFDRIYAMLTNVLVSEVVEADRPGWVQSQFQSGRRLLTPDARSVFRNLASVRHMVAGWPEAPRRGHWETSSAWTRRIGELVDSLTVLNPQLERLAASALPSDRAPPALVEEFKAEMSRYFDDSFSRLLAADPRETATKDDLLSALDRLGGTRSLNVDRLTIQATLWGGQRSDPLAPQPRKTGDKVIFGEDGVLAIDPALAEWFEDMAA